MFVIRKKDETAHYRWAKKHAVDGWTFVGRQREADRWHTEVEAAAVMGMYFANHAVEVVPYSHDEYAVRRVGSNPPAYLTKSGPGPSGWTYTQLPGRAASWATETLARDVITELVAVSVVPAEGLEVVHLDDAHNTPKQES